MVVVFWVRSYHLGRPLCHSERTAYTIHNMRWINVHTMLGQHLRRCPNIVQTFYARTALDRYIAYGHQVFISWYPLREVVRCKVCDEINWLTKGIKWILTCSRYIMPYLGGHFKCSRCKGCWDGCVTFILGKSRPKRLLDWVSQQRSANTTH